MYVCGARMIVVGTILELQATVIFSHILRYSDTVLTYENTVVQFEKPTVVLSW